MPHSLHERAVRIGAALVLMVLVGHPDSTAAANAGESKKPGLKESAGITLVQLEVTVWPKEAGSDACLGLTADDFELLVDREPQPIYAVDPIGAERDADPPATPLAAEATGGGLSLVLLFDLWHLNVFHRAFDSCPITKPLAFREARSFIRNQFHDSDRLLLVTFAGWPVVHYGWIRTQADALRALERLEKHRQVMLPRQEHAHHRGWIAGMESLFLALGRYPGRKDVLYLADDFRFDDVAMRMNEIVARAQSNSVVVNAVDLLSSCRTIPGPGCVTQGGLGCTEFRSPVALSPLSRDTGGQLFLNERIASAVRDLRAVRKCRYVVSFRQRTNRKRRPPSVKISLRPDRKDVSLLAPSSYETPEKAPSKDEANEALFLLPRFGRGISAEATLWPYRPTGKRGRWKAFVLVRVERTDDEPLPDELNEITVTVLPSAPSQSYGEYRKLIAGDDLEAFRARGATRLMLFPVEGIRPGETTVSLTVTSNVEEVSANTRRSFDVPHPPGPGEAHPWFLSDRTVRIGESEVLAPSMDDVGSPGQPLSFIGYGCRPRGEAAVESHTGRLVPFAGGPAVPVPVTWMDVPRAMRGGCGWLAGRISAPLDPGLWIFEPPPTLAGRKGAAAVEFSVVSPTSTSALPAEATPR